jgi:hypothetical protein
MSKTDSDVDYFFFRRFFAGFFAAAFFLFFAIAALLAWWMATQCSAVANRRALTSDYYSRKKLTVTSIAFVRNWRVRAPRAMRFAIADSAIQPNNFSFAQSGAAESTQCENADETWLSVAFHSLIFSEIGAPAASLSRVFRHREKSTRKGRAGEKIFCAGSVLGCVDGLGGAQIARISANRFAATARLPTARRVSWRRFASRIDAL